LSENGRPPKLRKPGTDEPENEGSRKFKKTKTNIRKKLDALELKKQGNTITSKVSSLKSKTNGNKQKNEGPPKLRTPQTKGQEKSRSGTLKKDIFRTMKERPLLSIISVVILIIIIISLALWVAGDNSTLNNTNNSSTNQTSTAENVYNDGNISFEYPEGWNITNSTGQAPLIVTISENENNSLSVFKEELGTTNFTYRVAAWRANILQNGMIYYEGDLTIDNITAYELEANYKPEDKVFTTRGIAFQKNNTAYFVIFVFDQPLLDYKDEMDTVINSFHVIEGS
jgi:hypothetical protein